MTRLEKKVWAELKKMLDPELNVSLVDLGLIYKIKVKNDQALITMTLTTMGCPLFGLIQQQIEEQIKAIKGIKAVEIKLVFEPPWSMEMMSDGAKLKLGLV